MPEAVLFPAWHDETAGSLYPFADDATLATTDGLFVPKEAFLDACVYPVGGGSGMYVSAVVRSADVATVYVGTAEKPKLCSAAWPAANPPYTLQLADTYGRPAGLIVCDPTALAVCQTWPEGPHAFGDGAAVFAATVCIPVPDIGLRGFVLDDGTVLTGDIVLACADGIVCSLDVNNSVRFDVVGDPLAVRRLCGTSGFVTPRFVKTINGVAPDARGDWRIIASDNTPTTALRVTPVHAVGVDLRVLGRLSAGA
jgi:hypothetical protein